MSDPLTNDTFWFRPRSNLNVENTPVTISNIAIKIVNGFVAFLNTNGTKYLLKYFRTISFRGFVTTYAFLQQTISYLFSLILC